LLEIAATEKRTIRTLTEALAVVEREPGLFRVYGEDGTEYTVDGDTGACTCPDAEYNPADGEECKHARGTAGGVGYPSFLRG